MLTVVIIVAIVLVVVGLIVKAVKSGGTSTTESVSTADDLYTERRNVERVEPTPVVNTPRKPTSAHAKTRPTKATRDDLTGKPTAAGGYVDPTLDPLNPLSPISPLNPINQDLPNEDRPDGHVESHDHPENTSPATPDDFGGGGDFDRSDPTPSHDSSPSYDSSPSPSYDSSPSSSSDSYSSSSSDSSSSSSSDSSSFSSSD